MTTYFTDRDLGKSFGRKLADAGIDVVLHHERFDQACPDEVWLAEIGRSNMVAVTHDLRIRYKPNELAAVVRHRVRLLVMIGKATHDALADNFVATWSRIERFVETTAPPFIAKVHRPPTGDRLASGSVSLWYPPR